MRKTGKKLHRMLALALLCVFLTGCTGTATESLYALPRLPAEYESLEEQINALLEGGAEHAAPTSGSNLQSVQMVDLDGDGVEEAVAFFRKPSDQRPMKIYFFRSEGDEYRQMAMIEGTASSLYSIDYIDLDGDGQREILVGFKSGTEVQVLSVYTLRGAEMLNLLTTAYLRYAVSDLDGDGRQELTVLYSGEENRCMADCYVWNSAELRSLSRLELSFAAPELSRVTAGALADGAQALYITGVYENSVAIYDILTIKNGVLQNIAQNTSAGGGVRFLSIYPTDIDASGVVEVPEPLAFPSLFDENESYYRIFWRDYDSSGESSVMRRTFHNTADGWYLQLPEEWDENVSLFRVGLPDENSVTFYRLRTGEAPRAFLEISVFTGDGRERSAAQDGRIVLARQVDAIYTARFLSGEDWSGQLDEESVKERFGLIVSEWTMGEN